MAFRREDKDGCAHVTIDGELSIYEAAGLRKVFRECFDDSDGLVLNLGQVRECDLAGVQLLLSAQATSELTGKSFSVSSASVPVTETAEKAGMNLSSIFANPQEV